MTVKVGTVPADHRARRRIGQPLLAADHCPQSRLRPRWTPSRSFVLSAIGPTSAAPTARRIDW